MSLTGQLNDLSLGELIEFFCNQRKTGRLKVDYALAPGVFFMDAGELVDAKVGALNGAEAVYFAMTLPSASFDFTAGVRSSRRTINERWPGVVLEGLRRIDEGLPAASEDAFHGDTSLDGATLEYLECVGDTKTKPSAEEPTPADAVAREIDEAFDQATSPAATAQASSSARAASSSQTASSAQTAAGARAEWADAAASTDDSAPFSLTVEAATASGGGRRKAALAAAAAVLVVCAVASVPISRRLGRNAPAAPAVETNAATPEAALPAAPAEAGPAENADAVTPTPDLAAEEAARRAREAREREARERTRRQREEAARRAEEGVGETPATASAAPKPAASGPKTVRVQISYDEAGRVTQAAAVGTSPGAEAYASTAVRVARGRRFPAGKAGTTVVTIPIN
jgi:hypothetical protein